MEHIFAHRLPLVFDKVTITVYVDYLTSIGQNRAKTYHSIKFDGYFTNIALSSL